MKSNDSANNTSHSFDIYFFFFLDQTYDVANLIINEYSKGLESINTEIKRVKKDYVRIFVQKKYREKKSNIISLLCVCVCISVCLCVCVYVCACVFINM